MKIFNSNNAKCHQCATPFTASENVLHQLAESLGTAIDAKDPFTSLHSEEVAEISHAIALSMGLTTSEADIIHVAGHLHDIGKIGIPDAILKKTGPLSDDEWAHIKQHSDIGAGILEPVGCLCENGIVEMVRYHHERFDGRGYPQCLKEKQIPIGARIIALADSLSAILQNRPYRLAQHFDIAVKEIINCSGTQFDPKVVDAFLNVSKEIESTIKFLNPHKNSAA